jgi:hypothetical protein
LHDLAIALDKLFLHIETQVSPGFGGVGEFAFIIGSEGISDFEVRI